MAALQDIPHIPGIVLPISTVTGTVGRLIRVGNEPLSVTFTP